MLTINQPHLTPEQIASIPEYRRKWQEIAINGNSIDKEQAKAAIYNAYSFLNLPQPNIVFFTNPQEAIQRINREIDNSWGKFENSSLGNPIAMKLASELMGNLSNQIQGEIFEHLQGNLDNGLADNIASNIIKSVGWHNTFPLLWAHARSMMLAQEQNSPTDEFAKNFAQIFLDTGFVFNRYVFPPLWSIQGNITNFIFKNLAKQNDLNDSLNKGYTIVFTGKFDQINNNNYQLPAVPISSVLSNVIIPSVITDYAYYINFLNEVLNCSLELDKWKVLYDLITTCGWIFPYQKIVVVCDRHLND